MHKHVFVGGLHRSGTSLFAEILGRHADISSLSGTGVFMEEGQHVQDVYPSDEVHGGPGRFGLDEEAHLTEDWSADPLADGVRLREAWAPYWDLSRSFLVEKSPPNLIRSRFLQAAFPGACFIFLVRHPVVSSLAVQKWSMTSLFSLVTHWIKCHELMRADAAFLERALLLPYEHLVQAPSAALRDVARFLGVDDLDRVPVDDIRPSANDRYESAWSTRYAETDRTHEPDFVPAKQLMRMRKEATKLEKGVGHPLEVSFSKREGADLIAHFGDVVESMGYSLVDFDIHPGGVESIGGRR